MSDSESLDYLQEDFDPRSLTVPRLRSILVTYNVQYPATAKKSQLVDLFNENVAPRSKSILETRAKVKRMSRGIVDADSQSTASSDFVDQELMLPPARVTRSMSPRKSSRVTKELQEQDHASAMPSQPVRESPRKRQSRSTSVQAPAATSDTDTGPDMESSKATRRARRMTPVAPAVKEEVSEDDNVFKRTPAENASVFTSDNPFQSGSSPSVPPKSPSSRRKTTGVEPARPKTPSASRRRTDGPAHEEGEYPARAVSRGHFGMPATKGELPRTPKPRAVVESEALAPGEEFTPEEQLALASEERANPELAVARRKPHASRPTRSFTTPLLVLITTLFGAYAAWYRQEKIAVGYCGLGREPNQIIPATIRLPEWAEEWASNRQIMTISEINVPDWLQAVTKPECEPCPQHAYCYEDFSVRCEQGYVLKPHPLSVGGILPLPPTCEPDGEKARRVQAVADKAVEALRERRATYECGDSIDEEGHFLETPAIDENELKETISKQRTRRMNAEEFEDLWAAAIGEVKARDEVVVEVDEVTGGTSAIPTTRLSTTSLARLPYTCAVRRSVRLGLARYRLSIVGLVMLVVSTLYGRRRYLSNRAVSAQIPALVDEVLERLSNQKELAFEDGVHDAFLFLPNLRDDVLRHIHSLSQRNRIWQRVRVIVEQNSNVRTGQRESHNGELGRAWEWIGPSRVGNGDLSERRRKSGRVSFGPSGGADAGDGSNQLGHGTVENKSGLHRRWEESRPVY